MPELNPLLKTYYLLRYLGPRVVWLRAGVYWDKWRGTTARTYARRPWKSIELTQILAPGTPSEPADYATFKRQQNLPFLFPLGNPPQVPDAIRSTSADRRPSLPERLELLGQMRAVYFFNRSSPTPVDWYQNPIDGRHSDPSKPWYELIDFFPQQGDMRLLWEPARAAWAIDLARARPHGHDIAAGELLWRWIDSWMEACQPYMGFQWGCGQEASIRLIALALGVWSTGDDASMTPQRWLQFARLAWATTHRVEHHIRYAISQKNNHALSEATGLLLAASLFPEMRDAPQWWSVGQEVLASEVRRQVYDDGAYVQSSMNYHRVMLQVAGLSLRLAELAEKPFDRDIYDRIGAANEFLFQMMEPETGRVPLYGNNDGAWVLPLDECDFTDYRPVLQATHYLVHRERRLPQGPWDEDLLWLFGPQALSSPPMSPGYPGSSRFDSGGYYTLRRGESWMMMRCHTYRDRVHQLDPLHVDLWWRGQNVLVDCGSELYYIPDDPRREYYYKSIAAHNTIEIDGTDPATAVSRFLWLPWLSAQLNRFEAHDQNAYWLEGEHYGYRRRPWRVTHRRAVITLPGDDWVIVDDLVGEGHHQGVLRWHMLDVPFQCQVDSPCVRLDTPQGALAIRVAAADPDRLRGDEVVRGSFTPARVQGLVSRYYAQAEPIPTLEVRIAGACPIRLVTVVAPGSTTAVRCTGSDSESEIWEVTSQNSHRLHLRLPGARKGIVDHVERSVTPALVQPLGEGAHVS